MAWRLPLLNKTLKSLETASKRTPTQTFSAEASKQKYQRVKDLARKRLDRADIATNDYELTQ